MQTPDQAYIEALQVDAMADIAVMALVIVAIISIVTYLFMRWCERRCDRHDYQARSDQLFDNEMNKWRTIYVRDVCSHCGATVERGDQA